MPRGGHARSGPAPDPNSARSDAGRGKAGRDGWRDLPSGGYTGRIPAWPLDGKTPGEHKLWRALWRKPQAEVWAEQQLVWQVAHYARTFLEATEPGSPASLKTAVLRQEDTLGLSTVGLAQLRWRIPRDEVGAARAAKAAEVVERPAPVRRLRAAASE